MLEEEAEGMLQCFNTQARILWLTQNELSAIASCQSARNAEK